MTDRAEQKYFEHRFNELAKDISDLGAKMEKGFGAVSNTQQRLFELTDQHNTRIAQNEGKLFALFWVFGIVISAAIATASFVVNVLK